ncbi:hypothetical protein K6025_00590 [Ehrlichia sp. JZT12]
MKLKESNINGMLILCVAPIATLYNRMEMLHTQSTFSGEGEESNYLRNVMIGCLNLVLCSMIYIMILIHFNIKLMLSLLFKIIGKDFNELNSAISRLIDTRVMHFIILHIHLKFLSNISKNKLDNKSKIYEDFARKTNIIIKSIEHHRKLYENFVLPI